MENINTNRRNEKITGAFFITATTSAIIGLKLYDPVLTHADFLSTAGNATTQIAMGALFELILAFANIGTGIMLYPRLKSYSERWGLAYTLFRLLEVVFILIGITSMLVITSLLHSAANAQEAELAIMQVSGKLLKTVYSWAFILGPHFMLGINTFIYSSIFYQAKLLPRKLSSVGMLGAVLIFLCAVLEILGYIPHFSSQIVFFALPIAVYEMVLAGWLIAKGFNKDSNQ